ncbi:MAG: 2-C-methyl-D-erythritol 2,4-cyclodiphosphate synthase [Thiohalomonadales bacterium]
MRIGHGYDAHQFTDGDFVILGGHKIAHEKSLKAHSDGDVVLHAVCDAMLGALALGDIGEHFPDNNQAYKGISSRELLRQVNTLISEKSYQVSNMDITIVAQAPKIAAHKLAMRENIAADVNIELDQINIKATTTEGMGFTGRGEGIATHAVVLLSKKNK